jgi:hypothetical protein
MFIVVAPVFIGFHSLPSLSAKTTKKYFYIKNLKLFLNHHNHFYTSSSLLYICIWNFILLLTLSHILISSIGAIDTQVYILIWSCWRAVFFNLAKKSRLRVVLELF